MNFDNYKLCTAESQGQRAEKKVSYYVRINIQSTNSNLLSDLYIPEVCRGDTQVF